MKTAPSTVIDGELKHLGVPSIREAADLVAAAPDRNAPVADSHYVGLSLEATSAWTIASSVIYLALAGAALVFGSGIAGDAPWRAAALLMVAGFLADLRGLTLVGGIAALDPSTVFAWRLVPVLRYRGGVEGSG